MHKRYPRTRVRYRFFNRAGTDFRTDYCKKYVDFVRLLNEQISYMSELKISEQEIKFLRKKCGKFIDEPYLDFLRSYRYNPHEVKVGRDYDGKLSIEIEGPWYRTIFWEVPLMALISELYFYSHRKLKSLSEFEKETIENAIIKAQNLKQFEVKFADFGTRRRYSLENHRLVVETLKNAGCNSFVGTSNLMLAFENDLTPIGTQAHEWIMVHAAKYGYRSANKIAMGRWVDIFNGHLGIALTDTFTTDNFINSFDTFYAKLFDGVRQDSGEPEVFARKIIDHYKSLNIDPKSKTIVFSDNLNVDKAIALKIKFSNEIKCSFGIGTHFTNDVGVKPLNMVIKVVECEVDGDWYPTLKLSDDSGKNTCISGEEIEIAKKILKVDP